MNRRACIPLLFAVPALGQTVRDASGGDQDPEETRLMKLAEESPKEHTRLLRDYLRKKLDVAYGIALETAVNDEERTAIQAAQKHSTFPT